MLEARCKLIPSPQCRSLVLVGYRDGALAADQVPEVMQYDPIGLEMFDRRLVHNEEILGRKRRTDLLGRPRVKHVGVAVRVSSSMGPGSMRTRRFA